MYTAQWHVTMLHWLEMGDYRFDSFSQTEHELCSFRQDSQFVMMLHWLEMGNHRFDWMPDIAEDMCFEKDAAISSEKASNREDMADAHARFAKVPWSES